MRYRIAPWVCLDRLDGLGNWQEDVSSADTLVESSLI